MEDAQPIELVISDIDGTLVRQDKSLADTSVAAFDRLRDAGIQATLISARPPSGMFGLAETLGVTIPLGGFNGGTIFMRDGTVKVTARLDPDVSRTVLGLPLGAGVDTWLFGRGQWYACNTDNPRIAREILSSGLNPVLISDFSSVAAQADKIVFLSEDSDRLEQLEAASTLAIAGKATIARSQPYFLDVTAVSANKGDGVAALAQLTGVPLAQTAVIGDMPNDLPMFGRAGVSIAMGQAPDSVRSHANFVTTSNEEDGVAKAIDRFILLKARRGERS